MDVAALRADFPILDETIQGRPLIYLDNAATTQRPRQVLETLLTFYTRYNANIHRSPHTLGQVATDLYEQAHANVARFIGARSKREIIFTRNTTESLNLLAAALLRPASGALQVRPGDEVIVTVMEHHSNLVPWQTLCAEAGVTLRVAHIQADGALDLAHLATLLSARTRLVCCTYISNMLGVINPVAEIARLAHEAGALLAVDAAQAVPHTPVDVAALDCDFLAFSGHKMLAPFGSGVLYGREALLAQLSPFLYGGGMIEQVTLAGATWNGLPGKFEAGTPDVAAAVALGGARDWARDLRLTGAVDYLTALGLDAIHVHTQALTQQVLAGLAALPGVYVLGPEAAAPRGPIVAFTVGDADAHWIAQLLNGDGIAVRAGGHCAYPLVQALGIPGAVRVSPYFYNTEAEIAHFLTVLEDIVRHRLL